MTYENYSMIVLAGGKSSRMGTDKADLCIGDKSFLELQIEKGRELGIQDIQVSGYRGKRCPVPVTPDRFPEKGPLGGLESCLRRAKQEKCLVLGVDIPLIPVTELENLLSASEKSESAVTVLKHGDRKEPLIAVYHRDLADGIREEITQEKGKVFGFLDKIGYTVYECKAPEQYMTNVNTPEIYIQIKEREDKENCSEQPRSLKNVKLSNDEMISSCQK